MYTRILGGDNLLSQPYYEVSQKTTKLVNPCVQASPYRATVHTKWFVWRHNHCSDSLRYYSEVYFREEQVARSAFAYSQTIYESRLPYLWLEQLLAIATDIGRCRLPQAMHQHCRQCTSIVELRFTTLLDQTVQFLTRGKPAQALMCLGGLQSLIPIIGYEGIRRQTASLPVPGAQQSWSLL